MKYCLRQFYANGDHLAFQKDDYWAYTGTHWERREEDKIASQVEKVISGMSLEKATKAGILRQALTLLRAKVAGKEVFSLVKPPKPIINCRNGELHIQPDGSVVLKPHSFDSYLTLCLSVDYDPQATCPMYDEALEEIFARSTDPADMARHWNEFVGYAIQPQRDIASFWMMKGDGSNGKSKLMETISMLMGVESVAVMRVEELDTQFGYARLVGKLMMLDDDMKKDIVLPDGVLKQISEGKNLEAEFKGKTPFPFWSYALPVMLCNNFPRSSDLSHGMMRRAKVIPFDRQFAESEQDEFLFTRIQKNEMSGVLNRALEGLKCLRTRRRFQLPADCAKEFENWKASANPLELFFKEMIEPATGRSLSIKHDLYPAYVNWATDAKHAVLARSAFTQQIKAKGLSIVIRSNYEFLKDCGLRSTARP